MPIEPSGRRNRFLAVVLTIASLAAARPAAASAQGGTDTDTIDFVIEVEPVFEVQTELADGSVSLGPVTLAGGARSQTLRLRVVTNRGQPYRLIHRLEQPLTDPRGVPFPQDQLLLAVSGGENGGKSLLRQPTVLRSGEDTPIFSSGPAGEAARLTLTYFASGGEVIPAGVYRSQITLREEFR